MTPTTGRLPNREMSAPTDGHRGQRPDRGAEQRHPEQALAEAEPVLDGRYPDEPAPEREPVDDEDGEHGPPGAPEVCGGSGDHSRHPATAASRDGPGKNSVTSASIISTPRNAPR